MAKKKDTKSPFAKTLSISNRKASHEYHFLETFTAGIVLKGTEIKSIRLGKVSLQDAYCLFMGDELFVRGMHIAEYKFGTMHNHEEKADRKLLLSKKELKKLKKALDDVGLTIVPTKIFIGDSGYAKLVIALAKGKKLYDKREALKEKDSKRNIRNLGL